MQRYSINHGHSGNPMFRDNDGDWVEHAEAEAELSALRARVGDLEEEGRSQRRFIDTCSEVHSHNVKLKQKLDAALARLATLEAPPVVPMGHEVVHSQVTGWRIMHYCIASKSAQVACLRACAYAIETGKRPPHEVDGKEGGK